MKQGICSVSRAAVWFSSLLFLAGWQGSALVAAEKAGDSKAVERPYADLLEEVVPADKAAADVPLRPRENDSYFKLSNARVERGGKPWPVLVVDYEFVHEGKYNGQALIVRRKTGEVQTYLLMGGFFQKKGSIKIDLHFGGPRDPGPPTDAELYLTRQELRYGKFVPHFKVSNSATMGTMNQVTRPREWSADEAATLSLPPPDYANPNAHPEAGRDTPFAGSSSGGLTDRFVSPGHSLLGIEFRAGEWENEKCLAQLVPVYAIDQPVIFAPRTIAKDGYAVGGMNVKVGKYVDAVQLIFMKLKPDGGLDSKDSYTSDWIGPAAEAGKIVKLGANGRHVIGINCRHGAILDGVALVTEKAP